MLIRHQPLCVTCASVIIQVFLADWGRGKSICNPTTWEWKESIAWHSNTDCLCQMGGCLDTYRRPQAKCPVIVWS